MEHILRCNALNCRKELNVHAVVTTCSHIFCIDCANQLQLSGQHEYRRHICPACDAQLLNPDDVVVTNLNPTEDYKTSILSGLNPTVIMECAGRALSFWAYQTTQEVVYQEFLAKSLTDKYAALNTQLDKAIHNANGEISNLRNKMSNMQVDQDNFRRKNAELAQALREKTRKHLQTQELYDKLKRRAMLGQVQNAALDAVDHRIQSSITSNRFDDRVRNQQRHPPPPLFSNQQAIGLPQPGVKSASSLSMAPQPMNGQGNGGGNWAGFTNGGSMQNQSMQTPSTHRHRLTSGNVSTSRAGSANTQPNGNSGSPMQQLRVSPRQPLGPMTGNISSSPGFSGYGLSAGLKVSNPAGYVVNDIPRPVNRSRVAQRPASGFTGQSASNLGPLPSTNMFSNGESYYSC